VEDRQNHIMDGPTSALPDYESPPVVETVFAAAIQPLQVSVADLALFAVENLGNEFVTRTEQPPVTPPIEAFDGPSPNIAPSLSLLTGGPPIRLWFQTEDKTRLVQLQRDYLACNWQGLDEDVPYPRYPALEGRFLEAWDALSAFATTRGSDLVVTQCELTYVNHITTGSIWERHGEIDKVIRLTNSGGDFLPEPEDAQIAFRYRIPYEDRVVGRLYVQATPGIKNDGSPVIQLNMIARGRPIAEGRDGMIGFFRLAHEWIVRGFAAVTTDTAQLNLWRRKDQ
jgi:uncharacterized protein (TIGR04255 family)